jgi:hypothetical protein
MGERYDEYFIVVGRSRDSRSLTESNFHAACEMLSDKTPVFKEGATVDIPLEERLLPGVIIIRSGHWAVGWVEYLLVHESSRDALGIASDIAHRIEDYPILDEFDFSDRVCEAMGPLRDNIFQDIILEIDEIRQSSSELYSDIINGGRFVQGEFKERKLYSHEYPEVRLFSDDDRLRDAIDNYCDRFDGDEYE